MVVEFYSLEFVFLLLLKLCLCSNSKLKEQDLISEVSD